MAEPKKLIEVAMPIKEISAESVRDKSIRHGHISTLHLWWARRPLPVCRAVVFASLVPDPLDPNCPQAFKDAVQLLLGKENNVGDPYAPYTDIPWTSVYDPMEDNLRNRLEMFIGKFTQQMQQYLLGKGTRPSTGNTLSDFSLIKWDNKNNETILGKARKLIWVAHNSKNNEVSAESLLEEFDKKYKAIKKAEIVLYSHQDRHLGTNQSLKFKKDLENAIQSFLNNMPKVFDPFAGGGAIPLEAARLGCRSFANDINPVAHIIQKGSLEYPQRYGKPIVYSVDEFIKIYGEDQWHKESQSHKLVQEGSAVGVEISNQLSYDVEFYAKTLLRETEKKIGHIYSSDIDGNKLFVNLWARVGKCENPTCGAYVPLLKQFQILNPRSSGSNSSKKVSLEPVIENTKISFKIVFGETMREAWVRRGNLVCPCCGNVTDIKSLKKQFKDGKISERILVKVFESNRGYRYETGNYSEDDIPNVEVPNEEMQPNSAGGDTFGWGFSKWGQLFSKRQLYVLHSLIDNLKSLDLGGIVDLDYKKAIITYLGILIDRIAVRGTSFGKWHVLQATVEHLFGRQAIQMNFDYPEINPFSNSSGSALGQLDWVLRYIESESFSPFSTILNNASSGDKNQFDQKFLTATITDPPYYDAIAYADISDFFYVWLKRSLSDYYPWNFSTPQTPKSEECTALKHHHKGSLDAAKAHFENKLLQILDAIEYQTNDIVSIMFAHQSTEAWTTLCNSILGARMNITGSWATDTEMTGALKTDKAFLSSSVTVSCRPSQRSGYGTFKEVKGNIQANVHNEVEELYRLGFRGADLLTACFGKAVSEFGKFEKVEKADGTEVNVAELLEIARESAFNALIRGFSGDDFTKFYIGWLQLNAFSQTDFDDAATFAKSGLSINVSELFKEHILIKDRNKQTLANYQDRLKANRNLGDKNTSPLIDQVHRAMGLFQGTNRIALLKFINEKASSPDSSFWRVVTALDELLPKDSDDQQATKGLLANKESLICESKEIQKAAPEQGILEL